MKHRVTNHRQASEGEVSTGVDAENPADTRLCPSAPAHEKAILLGMTRSDGSIAFIKDRIEVTQEFVEITRRSREPETRFRFSSTCITSACRQWIGGKCSMPERLAAIISKPEGKETLPPCSIRADCRWFHQEGARACRICPLIVTRDSPS